MTGENAETDRGSILLRALNIGKEWPVWSASTGQIIISKLIRTFRDQSELVSTIIDTYARYGVGRKLQV